MNNDDVVTNDSLDNKLRTLKQSLEEKLDWIIGEYKKHDEDHTLISGKLSELEERMDTVEKINNVVVQ